MSRFHLVAGGLVVIALVVAGPAHGQDADGDGVPDGLDACPGFDDRLDRDFDTVPDDCEPLPAGGWHHWQSHPVSEAGVPWSVGAVDLDGDGDLDLLRGSQAGVEVLDNLGGLAFAGSVWAYGQGSDQWDTVVADVDGDGDDDLVVGDRGRGAVQVLANQCGTLVRGKVVALGLDQVSELAVADFDGDGDLDVAATDWAGGALVYAQDAAGDFAPGVPLSGLAGEPDAVAVGDLDGDGLDDLVISERSDYGALAWYAGGGLPMSGTRVASAPCGAWWYGCSLAWTHVHVADLSGDGEPDILASVDASLTVYENQGGAAGFAERDLGFFDMALQRSFDVDFDGDGDLDLLGIGLNGVTWLRNDWPATTRVALPTVTIGGFTDAAYADLDGDGLADLAAVGGWEPVTEVLAGAGGAFIPAWSLAPDAPQKPNDIAWADFDGDGDADLLVLGWGDDRVGWHERLGPGSFAPRVDLGFGLTAPDALDAADLDGDGDVDLVVGSGDAGLWWMAASGGGVGAPVLLSATSATAVALGDVDGDGDPDLVAGGWDFGDGNVRWLRNDGGGAFTPRPDLAALGFLPGDVEVVDLDVDGDLDVVWVGTEDGVGWCENLGGGVFAAAVHIGDTGGGWEGWAGIEAADFDGDGDPDLAYVANLASGPRTWTVENLGGGAFAAPVELDPTAPRPTDVVAGDLDGDGVVDLVITENGAGDLASVGLLRGDGAGSFGPRMELALRGYQAFAPRLADVDDDGDLDVLYASRELGTVQWLENPAIAPPDADGDGLTLAEELAWGLDPTAVDTDGDGITDGAEVFGQGGPPSPGGAGTPGVPCAAPPGAGTGTGTGGGAGTGTGGNPGTGTGTGADTGGGTGGGTGTGGAGPGGGGGAPGGCTCDHHGGPIPWTAALIALALGARRRRR